MTEHDGGARWRFGRAPAVLVLVVGLAGAPASARGGESDPGGRPPNLVLIVADDLGAGELGCYGRRLHATPNLDRLAAEGVRFETCWATPLCTPSRVQLLTGRYGFRTGYFDLLGRPNTPAPGTPLHDVGAKLTFADVLAGHGYVTGLAGKWQLTGEAPTLVFDCGFDEYRIWAREDELPPGVEHTGGGRGGNPARPKTSRYWDPCLLENGAYLECTPEDYGPDRLGDFAVDFVERYRDEPFLLYYPMVLAHSPWEPTPGIDDPAERTEPGLAACVAYLDHLVGRVVAAVERLGLARDTVVLFTADNGTRGRGKAQLDRDGVRVPLIAWGPGRVASGEVSTALVDLSDLFPTLVELAGAQLPPDHELDGRSLARHLADPALPHREWIYSYLGARKLLRRGAYLVDSRGELLDLSPDPRRLGPAHLTYDPRPEVARVRSELQALLAGLPGPESVAGLIPDPDAERLGGTWKR